MDDTLIKPAVRVNGEIVVPGDKSISHRAVILGSIAEGRTQIVGLAPGDDNRRTIELFRAMGVSIKEAPHNTVFIDGVGMYGLKEPEDVLYAGNSGTTARLMMGLLSAQPFFSVITGDESLRTRPMARVTEPLTEMGATIYGRKNASYLPVSIKGESLKGINYRLPVASAQVKSSLLLAGLYATGETVVEEPQRTRDHTERMLALFGANITRDELRVRILPATGLKGRHLRIPGDISSAAFFLVAASVLEDSEVVIRDVGLNPMRCGIVDILKKMGACIEIFNIKEECGEPVGDIIVKEAPLKGIELGRVELVAAIDEFPLLCVCAVFAEGRTTIREAEELRVKESDRIEAMAEALKKLGVEVEELEDGIVIEGRGKGRLKGGVRLETRGDHRIAMALSIMALNTEDGIELDDTECVAVSYPDFYKDLEEVVVR